MKANVIILSSLMFFSAVSVDARTKITAFDGVPSETVSAAEKEKISGEYYLYVRANGRTFRLYYSSIYALAIGWARFGCGYRATCNWTR